MNMTDTKRPLAPQMVRAMALTLGAVLLPVGYTMAQDSRANEDHESEMFRQFEEWISDLGERIKSDVTSGKIGENAAWARWWNFYHGEFRPELSAAVAEGDLSDAASKKLGWAIETAEVTQRIKAAVARGDLSEEEGHKRRETLLKTTNPCVFELYGDLFIWDAADPVLLRAHEGFESEVVERSAEANHREANSLTEAFEEAKAAGNADRMKILAMEIRKINDALENYERPDH